MRHCCKLPGSNDDKFLLKCRWWHSRYTYTMNMRIVLPATLSLLLCACGNRSDLMLPSESPPEDAGRYLIKPRPATGAAAVPAPESGDDDD